MCQNSQNFRTAGPSQHLHEWVKIGAPPELLSWISDGVEIPFVERPEPFYLLNYKLNFTHGAFVAREIS